MQRTRRIIENISASVSQWENIHAVACAPLLVNEPYDPYYFISMDLYYTSRFPDFETRLKTFPEAFAFETSNTRSKDRFLIGDTPVRLEYKEIGRYEEMISSYHDFEALFRSSGTYGLYRLMHGEIVTDPHNWIGEMRERLKQLSGDFWSFLFDIFQGAAEHFVSDLFAAAIRQDSYFFLISSSGYIRNLTRLLFTLNRQFESSGRQVFSEIYNLDILPENIVGRFESFIRQDGGLPLDRKAEVAELLATSVIRMKHLLQ